MPVWYVEGRDAPTGRSDALVRSALARKEQISGGGYIIYSSDSSLSGWYHYLARQHGAMTVASAQDWRKFWTRSGRSVQGGLHGARRRRSGGGPGEGCARRPGGTYLYLHAVGASNPVAVPVGG
jgi:hypothetical protein